MLDQLRARISTATDSTRITDFIIDNCADFANVLDISNISGRKLETRIEQIKLTYACALCGSPAIVNAFLGPSSPFKANINYPFPLQFAGQPLHWSLLQSENTWSTESLLEFGADPNAFYYQDGELGRKQTPLSMAAEKKNAQQFMILLKHGADPFVHHDVHQESVFLTAAWTTRDNWSHRNYWETAIVESINRLRDNAPAKLEEEMKYRDFNGLCLLNVPVIMMSKPVMLALINAGAKPNIMSSCEMIPEEGRLSPKKDMIKMNGHPSCPIAVPQDSFKTVLNPVEFCIDYLLTVRWDLFYLDESKKIPLKRVEPVFNILDDESGMLPDSSETRTPDVADNRRLEAYKRVAWEFYLVIDPLIPKLRDWEHEQKQQNIGEQQPPRRGHNFYHRFVKDIRFLYPMTYDQSLQHMSVPLLLLVYVLGRYNLLKYSSCGFFYLRQVNPKTHDTIFHQVMKILLHLVVDWEDEVALETFKMVITQLTFNCADGGRYNRSGEYPIQTFFNGLIKQQEFLFRRSLVGRHTYLNMHSILGKLCNVYLKADGGFLDSVDDTWHRTPLHRLSFCHNPYDHYGTEDAPFSLWLQFVDHRFEAIYQQDAYGATPFWILLKQWTYLDSLDNVVEYEPENLLKCNEFSRRMAHLYPKAQNMEFLDECGPSGLTPLSYVLNSMCHLLDVDKYDDAEPEGHGQLAFKFLVTALVTLIKLGANPNLAGECPGHGSSPLLLAVILSNKSHQTKS